MRAGCSSAAPRRSARLRPAASRGVVAVVALIALAVRANAGTGDDLCDPGRSTADTCVIVGNKSVPDQSLLTFAAPNIRVDGTITVEFSGHCAQAPGQSCDQDTDCGASAPCLRTATLDVAAAGRITVSHGGRIRARGAAAAGDALGAPGGTILLEAHDVTVAGLVTVGSDGRPNVAAGSAGRLVVNAPGTVTLESGGQLEASTLTGGCGGTVVIGETVVPTSVDLRGAVSVQGATAGGQIQVSATARVAVDDDLEASNTNANPVKRPPCTRAVGTVATDAKGGGRVDLQAGSIALTGHVRARGKEAPGGTVELLGELDVTVDTGGPAAAISTTGGQVDALYPAGPIALSASAGDVSVKRGVIEADGQTTGVGSDGGSFEITAVEGLRCATSGTPCLSESSCAAGEACVARGGNIVIAAPVSARGGSGRGFGCHLCEITATGTVTITGSVDVGGGAVSGAGGDLAITAGGDLHVGPGGITASGADGGSITLIAGERFPDDPAANGALEIVNGTPVRSEGLVRNGVGGEIELSGCNVTVQSNARVTVSGGSTGNGGAILAVARELLLVESLAGLEAVPDGDITLRYRQTPPSVPPDATFDPAQTLEKDATLHPCVACGNHRIEAPEACDGRGTCALPGQVCVAPGMPGECTCIDTCRTVVGIQAGEQCDDPDLGGHTCVSEGFPGGTLRCASDCTFDRSDCLGAICGDGIVGPDEPCDVGGVGGAPPSFGSATCASLGFAGGGSLVCAPRCAAVITLPHCSQTVTVACTTSADCPHGEPCVGGCSQCGNGFLDPGEECDSGARNSDTAPDTCRSGCTLPVCGDDVIDIAAGEECDDGAATGADRPCTEECRTARCGDFHTCSSGSCTTGPGGGPEQCDDGNFDLTDGCGAEVGGACSRPGCGNGFVDDGEECDDGNQDNDDGCDVNCTFPRCGNGVVDRDEECDPPSSCCTAACLLEGCNDGNSCTTERCDPVLGCLSTPNPGRPCSDANACTAGDVCGGAGECRGAAVSCESQDPCLLGGCDPAVGCRFIRRGGFSGLGCLPSGDLERGIEGLGSRLGPAEMRRLRGTTARIGRRLAKAAALGPGRGAVRQLRAARRDIAALVARLQKLRRTGRLETRITQDLTRTATDLSSGVRAVILALRT